MHLTTIIMVESVYVNCVVIYTHVPNISTHTFHSPVVHLSRQDIL